MLLSRKQVETADVYGKHLTEGGSQGAGKQIFPLIPGL